MPAVGTRDDRVGAIEAHEHPESPATTMRVAHLVTRDEVREGKAHLGLGRVGLGGHPHEWVSALW